MDTLSGTVTAPTMDAGPHLLDTLVHGRLDGVAVTPETGLVALTFWCAGGVRRLGVGVGPRVVGIGWLPAAPVFSAGSRHPLVAVLKAHAVGRSVRHVNVDDDGAVWITFGDEADLVRVRLFAARAGEARVLDAQGETLTFWQGERSRPPHVCEPEGSLDAVGDELARVSDGLTAELRRGALVRALRGLAKRLARRKEAVELDLERIDDVARLQRIGRMLLAQGANVPRGAAKVTLEDWEEGGTLDVELDPALPAKPQAVGFFAKAKRIQRGEAVMWARLEETQRQLDAVRALEAEVDGADSATLALLQRWMSAAKELGVRENEAMPARGRAKPVERTPFIEYASARGQRILVGRGSVDNDKLTQRVAKPHDIWMHTRGVPGAHVVIPLARGATLHPEVLVDAATLAAHHSDARGADFVEITWTEKRYVRKPRKAPPGRVTLDREKVLALRLEPDRLARLLASRSER